jgi:hypothetical protein
MVVSFSLLILLTRAAKSGDRWPFSLSASIPVVDLDAYLSLVVVKGFSTMMMVMVASTLIQVLMWPNSLGHAGLTFALLLAYVIPWRLSVHSWVSQATAARVMSVCHTMFILLGGYFSGSPNPVRVMMDCLAVPVMFSMFGIMCGTIFASFLLFCFGLVLAVMEFWELRYTGVLTCVLSKVFFLSFVGSFIRHSLG